MEKGVKKYETKSPAGKNRIIANPLAFAIVAAIIVAAVIYLQYPSLFGIGGGGGRNIAPSGSNGMNGIGPGMNGSIVANESGMTEGNATSLYNEMVPAASTEVLAQKQAEYPVAPDFTGISAWSNSKPVTIGELRGKVVLVDFWTYSCINCLRTLPYIKEWYAKYHDKGLVIVGVHTPEFDFEKEYNNVLNAVKKYGIEYPVALDNNYGTWSAYSNSYWPREYLIGIDGFIRYDHIGEGNYGHTEKMIQELLDERMQRLNSGQSVNESIFSPADANSTDFSLIRSPEIYLGYGTTRGNIGYSDQISPGGISNFSLPSSIQPNTVYLEGKWKANKDTMELAGNEGSIVLEYSAKKVNIVAESDNNSEAEVVLDGTDATGSPGSDVNIENNMAIAVVNESRLYNVVAAKDYGEHILRLNIRKRGFRIYTFTFG